MITVSADHLPHLTEAQMREVDRLAVEEYGILLMQMMENAGRGLARLARERFLGGQAGGKRVTVLSGPGGNGGGGLVAARRLAGWGASVDVYFAGRRSAVGALRGGPPNTTDEVIERQRSILVRSGVSVAQAVSDGALPETDLLIDALVGYSLRGAPTGLVAALIVAANEHPAPVLSLDIPSGVDSTGGEVMSPAVLATATLTLALPKTGLIAESAAQNVGELYLADISIPASLYAEPSLGIEVDPHLFSEDEILRVH